MAAEEYQTMRKLFLKLTLGTKCITPGETAKNTGPINGVRSRVHFCLRTTIALERCVEIYFPKNGSRYVLDYPFPLKKCP